MLHASGLRYCRGSKSNSGCPRKCIVAIWGLETDFGKGDMGKLPVFRVLATMAHDCRRTELFQRELLAAFKIVQRGDLRLNDMVGAYAGEIGQTQFLPSSYIKYGVDYDGNGHVDLRHSVPDVLASTANLLKTNGWKAGWRLSPGVGQFRSHAGIESLRGLSQDHRLFRRDKKKKKKKCAASGLGRCRTRRPLPAPASSSESGNSASASRGDGAVVAGAARWCPRARGA